MVKKLKDKMINIPESGLDDLITENRILHEIGQRLIEAAKEVILEHCQSPVKNWVEKSKSIKNLESVIEQIENGF